MPAEDLAEALAARFLAEGNYDTPAIALHPQAAALGELDPYFRADEGFAGLAVHSVGYTEGAEPEKVVIYVTRGSKRALRALPQEIEGTEVDINVIGKLKAAPASYGPSQFYERGGRIACGSSCAPSVEKYAGTFGALLRDGANLLALSNNHVFAACNHTAVGMPIQAPASSDSRVGRRAPTEIARHQQIIELRSGDPVLVPINTLDVATAIITNQNLVTSWQGDDVDGFDTPDETVTPVAGMRVKKFGRTSGLTRGVLEARLNTRWFLPYKTTHFAATCWFINSWTVRSEDADPFGLPGDSGSLIVNEDATRAVGLLFAVNTQGGYAIILPIEDVLVGLGNLQLVSGHGV
jgi:hypothetical protein